VDKHATAATIFAAILGLGGVAIITALTLASEQPYRGALLLCGIIACSLSVGVLFALLFIAPKTGATDSELVKQQRFARKEERNAPSAPRLTETEREKLAKALHEAHELLVTDMQNLTGAIGKYGNDIKLPNYDDATKVWADLSVQYELKLRKVMDLHGLIFDKVDISFRPLQAGLMKLSVDIRDVRRALGWPEEALREKTNALVRENGDLINTISLAKDKIKEKRRAYLDK
jgi:hypothetical protein